MGKKRGRIVGLEMVDIHGARFADVSFVIEGAAQGGPGGEAEHVLVSRLGGESLDSNLKEGDEALFEMILGQLTRVRGSGGGQRMNTSLGDPGALSILIVEDDEWNIDFLLEVLRTHGCTDVRAVADPRSALPVAEERCPDLVLLDLHMPYLSGFEVLEQLRVLAPEEDDLPVLIITSDDDAATRAKALGLGATDFLSKPFDPMEMMARVRHLLSRRLLKLRLDECRSELERLRESGPHQLAPVSEADLRS